MAIRRAFRNMPRNPAQLDRLFRDVDLPNNEVNDATLRDSVGCSVIGRSADSTGDPADIQASTNDRLLARTSDTLSFRQLTVGMVPDDLVTYAKIQNVSATDRLLGRSTVGAGDIEEIVCTAAGRALIDDADAAAQRTTLGLGTAATQNTGTSGANIPLLNGANTWSATQDTQILRPSQDATYSIGAAALSYTVVYAATISDGSDTLLSSSGTTVIHGSAAAWTAHEFYTGGSVSFRVDSGKVGLVGHSATTTSPSAGGAGALPATPAGYVTISINGVDRQIAYY